MKRFHVFRRCAAAGAGRHSTSSSTASPLERQSHRLTCGASSPSHLGARAGLTTLLVSFAVVAGGSGCIFAKPEPAPKGLEDLTRFILDRFEIKEDTDVAVQDAELHDAFINLNKELEDLEVSEDKPFKSVLDDIEEKHVDDLEGMDKDGALDQLGLAQGLIIADVVHCTFEQNQNLMLGQKSPEIHPDVYAEYDKAFDEETSPYADGDKDQLFWDLSYTLKDPPVGSAYSAVARGGARRVKAIDDEKSPFGDVLITRVHLPEPAVFEGEGSEFTLDFQLETYHKNADGDLLHVYANWRRMKLGPVDSSQEVFINTSLDGMVDWDTEIDAACADGTADSID